MSDAAINWADVLDLVARLDESGIAEAEVVVGDVQVRVSRNALAPSSPVTSQPPQPAPEPVVTQADGVSQAGGASQVDGIEVVAPMLGVVYLRPSPDADPFVRVGDVVEPDTTVAILEVMKLMNNVPAGVAGRVVEVCVEDGLMAEHGTVLLRVEPA